MLLSGRAPDRKLRHCRFQVCAIIGGVFTVAGIIDGGVEAAIKAAKKLELGKQF